MKYRESTSLVNGQSTRENDRTSIQRAVRFSSRAPLGRLIEQRVEPLTIGRLYTVLYFEYCPV